MKKTISTALLLALMTSTAALAQTPPNQGEQKPEASLPFKITKVASFDNQPWRIAFLPDGRMVVTEKTGKLWLITQAGQKTEITGVPPVLYGGQGGFLGVYISPNYARDNSIYLTYSEPHEETAAAPAGGRGAPPKCPTDETKVCGSSLALARARLQISSTTASLQNLQVIWHDAAGGQGGQFGGAVAFKDNLLYLSVGDRQRMTPAQDPNSPLGKILRMTLDGKPAPGNPNAGKMGAATIPIIRPPQDTELAKTAPVIREYTFPNNQNPTPSFIWSSGHRTPYGLAFAPNGQLWEAEHGPRGGDELNLIEPGKNYGWPVVAYAVNYSGVPIPSYDPAVKCAAQPAANQAVCNAPDVDRSKFVKPVIYWDPVIAVGGLTFVKGPLFKAWEGSALVSGMASKSLTRITFDGKGGAKAAERWDIGFTVRDVAVAPDGAIWLAEGALNTGLVGAIYRVTPN
jgi:glucose/arabinose dehydrogenase